MGCTSFLVGCYTNIKNDLLNFRIDIDEVFVKRVGRGDDTSFCFDRWINSGPLKTAFPKMYQLESYKRCKVSDRLNMGGLSWGWALLPSNVDHVYEYRRLSSLSTFFQPSTRNDQWMWCLSKDGEFHVDIIRKKNWSLPKFSFTYHY